MKRHRELFACVSALIIACGQNRDTTAKQDSGIAQIDLAGQRQAQEASAMSATTKNELGSSFQQPWIPGQPRDGDFETRSRYSARGQRLSDGRLVLWLDTTLYRAQLTGPRSAFAVADSVIVTGLATNEFFTWYCRIGSGLADGQIGGLARTLVPEQWERPRIAWAFDTATSRIRSISTDSVTCAVLEAD